MSRSAMRSPSDIRRGRPDGRTKNSRSPDWGGRRGHGNPLAVIQERRERAFGPAPQRTRATPQARQDFQKPAPEPPVQSEPIQEQTAPNAPAPLARVRGRSNIVGAALFFLATSIFASPDGASAKPHPVYKGDSVFSYTLGTQTPGIDNTDTILYVSEIGGTHMFRLSGNPKEGAGLGLTVMGLGGIIRCDGVPMAEGNFFKIAMAPNIAIPLSNGKFGIDPGIRLMRVFTRDASFIAPGTENLPMGPIIVEIPGEGYTDFDAGLRVTWERYRRMPGFFRKVKVQGSEFDMNQEIRPNSWRYLASVEVQGGWGLEIAGNSRVPGLGYTLEKGWMLDPRTMKMFFAGLGFETGPQSLTGYFGAMYKDVMATLMYATEDGDPSVHLLITVKTDWLFGGNESGKPASGQKPKHLGPGELYAISPR